MVTAMKRLLLGLLALALTSCTAHTQGAVTMYNNPGGYVSEFMFMRDYYMQSGTAIRISGTCMSACTMYLKSPLFCVYPGAELWFHAPTPNSDEARQLLLDSYPPRIRQWIAAQGGLTPAWIILKGDDLQRMVAQCKD